jgi:hypothetical protein
LRRDDRELLRRIGDLGEADRHALECYLEFLLQRAADRAPDAPRQPLPIERPESESVVAAMRRLTATYPMIDPDRAFHRASALMSDHLIAGRDAGSVIDDLEALFEELWAQHGERRGDS